MRKVKNPKAKAWEWYSKWIRLRDADENGYVKCCTCDAVKFWKEMQAGHFVAKGNGNSVLFIEENTHSQCPQCNMHQHGNLVEYYIFMLARYGQEVIDAIRKTKTIPLKMHESEFMAIADTYRTRAKEELKKRGLRL